jgi:hypothetical protein
MARFLEIITYRTQTNYQKQLFEADIIFPQRRKFNVSYNQLPGAITFKSIDCGLNTRESQVHSRDRIKLPHSFDGGSS